MAEIVGVLIGAVVTIGKIIYDEVNKIGRHVTSCGGHRHDDDETPVPDSGSPRKFRVELGQETIRRLIKRDLPD